MKVVIFSKLSNFSKLSSKDLNRDEQNTNKEAAQHIGQHCPATAELDVGHFPLYGGFVDFKSETSMLGF